MLNTIELEETIDKFISRKAVEHPWLNDRKPRALRLVGSNHPLSSPERPSAKLTQPRRTIFNRSGFVSNI